MKPKVIALYTDGINRDQETSFAFEKAGAECDVIHLNQLAANPQMLDDYQIMAIPGGFSHGDDIVSGKIMANKLLYKLTEHIKKFFDRDTLSLGICNGFQVLIRIGILPYRNFGKIEAALMDNQIGHLESRWIKMRVQKSDCVFTRGMEGKIIAIPIANGEGRFVAEDETLDNLENADQVVLKYVDDKGNETMDFPANASASMRSIAGITDPTGKIFGLMPHPECYTKKEQHPNWHSRDKEEMPHGLQMFINAVEYFK